MRLLWDKRHMSSDVEQLLMRVCTCKSCKHGGFQQPLANFHKQGNRLHSHCKDCVNGWARKHRREHPERVRAASRKWYREHPDKLSWYQEHPERVRDKTVRHYNATQQWYERKLADQNGRCGICRTDKSGFKKGNFAIDHDHHCLEGHNKKRACDRCRRGLLCNLCNMRLSAHIEHRPAQLTNAEKRYLKKYEWKPEKKLEQDSLFNTVGLEGWPAAMLIQG